MKAYFILCPLLIAASTSFSQLTTAQNGLSQPNASTVQLGGTLLQHTNVDLGSSYNLGILKGSSNYFSILNNGNVGIGTATPGVRLDVNGQTQIKLNSGEFFNIKMAGPLNWNRGLDFNITDADGVSNSYGLKFTGYNDGGNRIIRINQYNANGMSFSGGSYIFENRTLFYDGLSGPYHADLGIWLKYNSQNPAETGIKFYTEHNPSTPLMSIMQGGNVGVGTPTPGGKLSVIGSNANSIEAHILNTAASGYSALRVGVDAVAPTGAVVHDFNSGYAGTGAYTANTSNFGSFQNNGLNITADNASGAIRMFTGGNATGNQRLIVDASGNVGIGTSTPQSKLAVNGDITAKKVRVTPTGWADYVFDPSYILRPLTELEQFIGAKHHLPEIPSAAEVEKNGIDLGDNQALLLKKIEELTLYVIDLNKKVQQQQEEIIRLKNKAEGGSRQ